MGFVTPTARLVVPRVEESLSPIEVYIDGAVFTAKGGVAHIVGYVERVRPQETVYYEVLRVHLPVEGMLSSMMRAQAVFVGGLAGH